MTAPTLTVTIDRTSLSLSALVLSGSLGTTLGIVGFQLPGLLWRLGYMPDADDIHGSELVSAAYQQGILNFDWVRDGDSTETEVATSYAEVAAAISQFSYTVTTQVSGAPAQVWSADPGSMPSTSRTYPNLANSNPVYAVSIPVYPIAGA